MSTIGITRVEQRSHAEKLAEEALNLYELNAVEITLISQSQNTVFRVAADTGRYALRIHQPGGQSTKSIMAELLWLQALRQSLMLAVPEPVPTVYGSLVAELTAPYLPETRQVVLFKWLPGKKLGIDISPDNATAAGRFIGYLHHHVSQFSLPEDYFRPHANFKDLQIWQSPSLLEYYNIQTGLLEKSDAALCVETAAAVTGLVHEFNGPHDYGLIHADLHPFNFVLHDDRLGALDFDDCLVASFCLDLAVFFSALDHRVDFEKLRDCFFEGYTAVHPLPQNCEKGVASFMVVRALETIAWILSWPGIDHKPFGPELLANSLARIRKFGV